VTSVELVDSVQVSISGRTNRTILQSAISVFIVAKFEARWPQNTDFQSIYKNAGYHRAHYPKEGLQVFED
jgi:hypothetical protein